MGNSFRPQPLPTIYPANPTPFASDLLEVGILVAFAMIAFSFIVIIPGIRGWEVSTPKLIPFSSYSCPCFAALMGLHTSVCGPVHRGGDTGLQLWL